MAEYQSAWLALGSYGALYLLQVLVADFAGIRAKHIPGMPITDGHRSFLFRASRCHANTTETIGVLGTLTAFAIGVGTAPGTVAAILWACVATRIAYTLCYWFDWRIPRSTVFTLYILTLLVLFGAGLRTVIA